MPPRKPTFEKMAQVDIHENTPVGRSEEVLIAQNEERMVSSEEKDGDGVTTTHVRPGTLIMYKPSETQGYVPRTVSASAIRLLLKQGWKEVCPDCDGRHVDSQGRESTDPNLCAARDPVAVRICRVCQKRIYDNQRFQFDGKMGADDPNVIEDDFGEASSPEQRTLASLNLHYWLRHPREAQMMNIPPLPAAMRDMAAVAQEGGIKTEERQA